MCGRKTDEQFHNSCLYVESIQTRGGMTIEVLTPHKDDRDIRVENKIHVQEKRALYHSLLVFGVIGLFLFVYSSYLVTGGNLVDIDRTSSIIILKEPTHYASNQENVYYENCLGSGTGKSITVTCPNDKGFVYRAVLDLPRELAIKFSNDVFAIRGISLSEKSYGSVVLEYQKNSYTTRFLQSEKRV